MRRQDRMEQLKANGVDTSKYFQFTLDKNMMSRGVTLKLDGNNLTVQLADEVEELKREIQNNGTVACTKLYRRWICAQMLRIQKGIAEGRYKNIDEYMNGFTFRYMTHVFMDELDALNAIRRDMDADTYHERAVFFIRAISASYDKWIADLDWAFSNAKIHIQNRYRYRDPKREYVTIGNRNWYVSDLKYDIEIMKSKASTLRELHDPYRMKEIVKDLTQRLGKFDNGRESIFGVPSTFCEAYKASGSYYTLKNLVLFHNAELKNYETGEILTGTEAFRYLKTYLQYAPEQGYKIYALMKDCLERNGIRLDNLF